MEPRSLSVAILFLVVLILAAVLHSFSDSAKPDRDGAPPKLIVLNMVGRGSDKISLAVEPHDLSLAGFANGSHHWYVFPGHEDVITNGTTLPFGNTYRDLIGGLANLPSLPLGREPALDAIGAVSACDDPARSMDDDDDALKRGLATLTVTNCEAVRLTPVNEVVSSGWESGDARLTEQQLAYIEHWDTISFELVRAHKTGQWYGPFTQLLKEHANIHSKEEALAVVSVIANPTLAQVLTAHARSA